MRAIPLIALVAGAAALAGCFGLAATQDSRDESALDVKLQRTLDEQERLLEGEFERTADIAQFMAANSAFSDWYEVPRNRATQREAQATLARLGRIYGARAGAISFVDRSGYENARVVHGRVARTWELSSVENRAPYFTPTMALAPGQVHVTRPYVSPHTGEWIFAAATRIPEGARDAIVRVELSLESLRGDMQALAGDAHVTVVDTRTDAVVLETGRPRATASGRRAAYIASVLKDTRNAGVVRDEHTRASFLRVATGRTNANSWVVIVASERPPALGLQSFGSTAVTLLVAGLLLVALAFAAVRRDRREAADRIAIAMAARDDAERRSRTDALTDLLNRRGMSERLQVELDRARREGSPPGLLLVDVDRFKEVNDRFGHASGDAVLVEVGARIAGALRSYDAVSRWGGEEFVVLVSRHVSQHELRACAERVRNAVSDRPIVLDEVVVDVTVSVGGAAAGQGRWSVEALADAADRAMYAAKRAGRDRVCLYGDPDVRDPDAEEPEAMRIAQALALSASVREGVPELHCQQVADLAAATAAELGMPEAAIQRARLGGWLHDVGKVAIPDAILAYPGALDEEQWRVMRSHAEIGEQIVARVPGLRDAAQAVRHHHERWDGAGTRTAWPARRSPWRPASWPPPTPTRRSPPTVRTPASATATRPSRSCAPPAGRTSTARWSRRSCGPWPRPTRPSWPGSRPPTPTDRAAG